MLYCRNCGQCIRISADNFYEIRGISGTRQVYLDPEKGEIVDYGDDETEYNDDSTLYCSHCDSDDVAFDEEEITSEEAFAVRAEYDRRRLRRQQEIDRAKIKDSVWDPAENF